MATTKQEQLQQYPNFLEAQQQFPYSVRIEQTAKGARISVHTYNRTLEETITEAVQGYNITREKLIKAGFKIAPEE